TRASPPCPATSPSAPGEPGGDAARHPGVLGHVRGWPAGAREHRRRRREGAPRTRHRVGGRRRGDAGRVRHPREGAARPGRQRRRRRLREGPGDRGARPGEPRRRRRGGGGTYPLAISGDGRRVAYVAGDRVAVFDLEERATVFVAAPDGHAAAVPVALDHEGATLLLGAATAVDVQAGYLVDLRTLSFTRIGALEGGGFADVRPVDLSADGRTVVFETPHALRPDDADDLLDLYAYDVAADEYRLVSATADGTSPDGGAWAWGPVVSGDGRYVDFYSDSTSLPGADGNDGDGVYRNDLDTGELELVSTSAIGAVADDDSVLPTVSADGRYVAFGSYATNLTPLSDDYDACFFGLCPQGFAYVK